MPMSISVGFLSGSHITDVELLSTETVGTLRLKVERKLGHPSFDLLNASGDVLCNDATLESVGLATGGRVQAVCRVVRRIHTQHAEAATRAELIFIDEPYNPHGALVADGKVQWNVRFGTTTQEFWFGREPGSGIAQEAQWRFSFGEGVMEPDFLARLGSILYPGEYDVVHLSVKPQRVDPEEPPTMEDFRSLEDGSDDTARDHRKWDPYYLAKFSSDGYYRCELAPTVTGVSSLECFGERGPPCASHHLVLHTIAPLQTFESLDDARISEFEAQLQSGISCTAWAIGFIHTDDWASYAGNPWIKSGVASFLLDGHHKVCAAARTGLPLGLVLFVPRSMRNYDSLEAWKRDPSAATTRPCPLVDSLGASLLPSLAGLSPETCVAFSPCKDLILELSDSANIRFPRVLESASVRDLLKLIVKHDHNCCLGPTEYLEGGLFAQWPPSQELLSTSLVSLGVTDGWQSSSFVLKSSAGFTVANTDCEIWRVSEVVEAEAMLARKIIETRANKKTKSNRRKIQELQQKLNDLRQREMVPLLIDKLEKFGVSLGAVCACEDIQEALRDLDGMEETIDCDDYDVVAHAESCKFECYNKVMSSLSDLSEFVKARTMPKEVKLFAELDELLAKFWEKSGGTLEEQMELLLGHKDMLKESVPLLIPATKRAHLADEARLDLGAGISYEQAWSRVSAAQRLQCGLCRTLELQ